MNPVPLMKLVEIIRGHHTKDNTVNVVKSVAERMGKISTIAHDYPGFIANRLLMPMINEAFYALMENVSNAHDIDLTMKLGCNFPMGPLALADLIGLDTCLAIIEVMHDGLGDDKYRPCPLLRNYVEAGLLGRKSGAGVFLYPNP
jgi:3-hydroxybutyryl-CoA dehydrogenase